MNRSRLIVLAAALAGLICASALSAQTVSVVSGNGQVLSQSNLQVQPLQVKVTDANGNPVGGATVNWSAQNVAGLFGFFLSTGTNSATSVTDVNGLASVYGNLSASTFPSINFTTSISQTNVFATAGSNTVTFTLTQLLAAANSGFPPSVQASLTNPQGIQSTFPGDVFSGAVGTAAPTIQIHVAGTNGLATNAIPGAAIQLLNYQDPSAGPAVLCAPNGDPNAGFGQVLTDVNGNATCTVAFAGQPGSGQFVVTVGGVPSSTLTPAGYWQFSPTNENNPTLVQSSWIGPILREVVAPGTVGVLKITQGNNQTVNPGQTLPVPLQVEVDDPTGKPLSGVAINWKVSPANAANLTVTSETTDFAGRAGTGVTLSGNASGTVTITATLAADSTKSASFIVTATPPVTITAFNIVSGNNQTASVNTPFAQPLVVQLTTSAGSPAGVIVQFSTSGPISLSSTSATTDSSGTARVNVTASSVTGAASVIASVAGAGTQTFSLTVTPPAPLITAGNFVNGADLQPNSLSPCSLGAITTPQGALSATGALTTFPGLPIANSNVHLAFNNIGAPILSVGTNPSGQQQIVFQVPCETTPGTAVPVTLAVGSGSTNVNLTVNPASPGIFQVQMSDGAFRAVLIRPDGSFVSLSNPARRGETDVALVTGLGPTTPAVGTQGVPQPGTTATVQGAVVVGMSGGAVPLTYAQLSPDLVGVYLVAFQIPANMTTGNNVTFSIGIQASGNTYYSGTTLIPVQ